MVAETVFHCVGVVGMAWPEEMAQVLVVVAVLVGVLYDEADGASGGLAFEYAAEQLYFVWFLASGGQRVLSGSAPVELCLNEFHVNLNAGWHSVNDSANGRTVTLAKSGYAEKVSKCVHVE